MAVGDERGVKVTSDFDFCYISSPDLGAYSMSALSYRTFHLHSCWFADNLFNWCYYVEM